MPTPLIVAIDGPSGAGKSTVARGLAKRLTVPYLDTGAMYRAVALKVLESGVSPDDRRAVEELAERADLGLERVGGVGVQVLLDGQSVGERIRSPEVGEMTSRISAYPGVRRRMVALQREWVGRLGGVVEGRDIGSVVFPDTPYKFYLEAPLQVRIQRRFEQLKTGGGEVSEEAVAAEVRTRDERDQHRQESPLTYDASYVVLDTTHRTPEEVIEEMVRVVEGK